MSDLGILVPWTTEQVDQLNRYQRERLMHPYTCLNRGDAEHTATEYVAPGNLWATPSGWICPKCDYRQNWAHAFTADKTALDMLADSRKRMFARSQPHPEETP